MLIRDAEVAGEIVDVRLADGRIGEIGRDLDALGAPALEARGTALLPGLHDHHIHLRALAASLASVPCGPPRVEDRAALARALGEASPRDGWIRGTGYHESVAGELDRAALDALRDDVPVRVQHRSGVMWSLNSRACEALGLDGRAGPDTERDEKGRSRGRLVRGDEWLRARLGSQGAPDLGEVGRRLARFGVTRVTDCTPTNEPGDARALSGSGPPPALPQKVEVMGRLGLGALRREARIGAHKIMLDEPALPEFDALVARIGEARREDRAVAFHVVTRAELLFATGQ